MRAETGRLTVLQAKFGAWLAWSQPFIHDLVRGVARSVDNVVVCNRTENLDRFAVPRLVRLPVRYVTEPRLALLAAAHLRRTYQPDAIHAHFGWSGLRMLLLKQYLRIPMVVTFGGRELGTMFHAGGNRTPYNPDFAGWAKACGVDALTITRSEDFKGALEHAIAANKPFLIDVHVDAEVRPPATGTWSLPPTPHKEPVFGKAWLPGDAS